MIAQRLVSLLEAKEHLTQAIRVRLPAERLSRDKLEDLRAILERHRGDCKAYLHLMVEPRCETIISLGDKFRVKPDRRLLEEINRYFGGPVVSAVLANGPNLLHGSRSSGRKGWRDRRSDKLR